MNDCLQEIQRIVDLEKKLTALNADNFESLVKYIRSTSFLLTKENFIQFVLVVDAIARNRAVYMNVYADFMLMFKEEIKFYFSKNEIFFFLRNRLVLRFLHENGLLCLSDHINSMPDSYLCFFADILIVETYDIFKEKREKMKGLFREIVDKIDLEKHRELCIIGDQRKLTIAIKEDNLEEFKTMIDKGEIEYDSHIAVSVYEPYVGCSLSLIYYTCIYSAVKIFKFIHEMHIVNNTISYSSNILDWAIIGGNIDIINFLKDDNENVKVTETAIETAYDFHRNSIANYLMKSFNFQITPNYLSHCIKSFNLEPIEGMMRYFIEKKIDINEGDYNTAANYGHLTILKLFHRIGFPKEVLIKLCNFKNSLCIAVQKEFTDIVDFMVKQREVDINQPFDRKMTALHLAVANGNIAILKSLLSSSNIDVNVVSSRNESPLIKAIVANNYEAFKLLLESPRIEINMNEKIPLFGCYNLRKHDMLKLLICTRKCNLNIMNKNGNTLLHSIVRNNDAEMLSFLVNNGSGRILYNLLNHEGYSALYIAIAFDSLACLDILLEQHEVDVNHDLLTDDHLYEKTESEPEGVALLEDRKDRKDKIFDKFLSSSITATSTSSLPSSSLSPSMPSSVTSAPNCYSSGINGANNSVSNYSNSDIHDNDSSTTSCSENSDSKTARKQENESIETKKNVPRVRSVFYSCPLIYAIQLHHTEAALKLINTPGLDCFIHDPQTNRIALHFAVIEGMIEVVEKLLEKSHIEINLVDRFNVLSFDFFLKFFNYNYI